LVVIDETIHSRDIEILHVKVELHGVVHGWPHCVRKVVHEKKMSSSLASWLEVYQLARAKFAIPEVAETWPFLPPDEPLVEEPLIEEPLAEKPLAEEPPVAADAGGGDLHDGVWQEPVMVERETHLRAASHPLPESVYNTRRPKGSGSVYFSVSKRLWVATGPRGPGKKRKYLGEHKTEAQAQAALNKFHRDMKPNAHAAAPLVITNQNHG